MTTIYANDLATDINPGRGNDQVSIGLSARRMGLAMSSSRFAARKGSRSGSTTPSFSWSLPVPRRSRPHGRRLHRHVQFPPDGCCRGFANGRQRAGDASLSAAGQLGDDLRTQPGRGSRDAAGPGRGGEHDFKDPTVYTYASPRTGDPAFASTYNQVVKNTFRIANRLDLVPKLPLPPVYEHVLELQS